MTPVERLLAELPEAKQSGKGWSARCPAHEDRRASLRIAEGRDGRALAFCHAGCKFDAICAAVGLSVADLMAEPSDADITKRPSRNGNVLSSKTCKTYPTACDAVSTLDQAMAKDEGKRVAQWTYHDAMGDPVAVVCRYDLPTPSSEKQRKTFRPVAKHPGGWRIGGMPDPRPLYCLPHLVDAKRVYIAEGEKAADAAREIGLTATTSAHGSQSPDKTDWTPLAGKECILLPDHDQPGEKYADTLADILAKLSPAAVVKQVELPDLPDHGDIADWVEARPDDNAAALRRQVEALADKAEAIQPNRPAAHIERFQAFPTAALPEPVRGFVVGGAKAIGCDASYLGLPLLTALAAAIGNTRRIELKRGWTASAILWTAIVGESGTAKTPAFKLVMQPLRNLQRKALEAHAEAMKQYEVDLALHDKAYSAWKRDKKDGGPPPEKPEPPQGVRYVVSDTTVEALAPLLQANPRGLLLARDELAGWIGSFDRYSGGKGGADAANWLSMHNGESIVVDRKTGTSPVVYVPQASVSVTGGIQPAILHRALGIEHRESGLAARLLLTCPPRTPKRWTEADIAPEMEAEMAGLFARLYGLTPTIDDAGHFHPVVVGMTREAKAAWTSFYNRHAEEQTDLSGDLAAAWSKLEEYAARLALVIHFTKWAADDPTLESSDVVDEASMKAGITLAEWFKAEARRVYALLGETDDDRDQRRLVEWIERKGGSVTPTEVRRGNRRFTTTEDAELALQELAKAGLGNWEPTPPGRRGQPTRRFVLSRLSTVYDNSIKPAKKGNTVDVDSVDVPETQPELAEDSDNWGEV